MKQRYHSLNAVECNLKHLNGLEFYNTILKETDLLIFCIRKMLTVFSFILKSRCLSLLIWLIFVTSPEKVEERFVWKNLIEVLFLNLDWKSLVFHSLRPCFPVKCMFRKWRKQKCFGLKSYRSSDKYCLHSVRQKVLEQKLHDMIYENNRLIVADTEGISSKPVLYIFKHDLLTIQ